MDEASFPNVLFSEEATRRVQLGLLIAEVIRKEEIKLDQTKVESTIEEMAVSYEQPDQVLNYYRQNQQARSGLESMVLEDQVVGHILDKASVTEKTVNFDDLMNSKL